jgi:hypothetical protein
MNDERNMEIIARRGDFRLIRFEKPDGNTGYVLQQNGQQICTDVNYQELCERAGFVSYQWDLFLATRPAVELWSERVPVPRAEPVTDPLRD